MTIDDSPEQFHGRPMEFSHRQMEISGRQMEISCRQIEISCRLAKTDGCPERGGTDLLSVQVYLKRFDNPPAEIARHPMVPGFRFPVQD